MGNFIAQKIIASGEKVAGLRRNSSQNTAYESSLDWKECDILDISSLIDVLKGAEVVVHCAALVSFNPRDKEKLHAINVEGTRNVVNACLIAGVRRLIHISSVAALGRQKGIQTISEDSKWIDSNLNSDYAETKYLAELEVYRGLEEGLAMDIVNPSIILSRSNWNRSSSQLFKYAWAERPFYTDGVINFVDVRDVAEMVVRLMNSPPSGERYIANAGSIEIKDLLKEMAIRFKKKAPWIRLPGSLISIAAQFEIMRSRATGSDPIVSKQSARVAKEKFYYSNKKAIKDLGMQFRPLEESLQWCCEYYLQNGTINI